jgi:hypothetical protein
MDRLDHIHITKGSSAGNTFKKDLGS